MKHVLLKANQFIHRKKLDGGVGVIAPDAPDERDFHVGFWGIGRGYERKHGRVELTPVSQKNQTGRNTCCYESAVGAKELDEHTELSVRSAVAWAKTRGFIKGDGFSSLKASQDTLQKFGAPKASLVDDSAMRWDKYSDQRVLSKNVVESAEKHRIKTYWKVSNIDEVFELLDTGRPVQTAMYWYTGYNMSGGFSDPWIIPHKRGYRVGAHAVYIIGYDTDYNGEDVIIIQNSYGASWGDNNKFYIKLDDFKKEFAVFGGYTNLDYEKDYGAFIRDYHMQDVKAQDNPKVYRIEHGKKRHYVNIAAYAEHRINDMFITLDSHESELLDKVPTGEPIT